jgi:hypothetical protein
MIFNVVLGSKDVTATLDPGYPVDITVTAGDEASFKVVVTDTGFPNEHTFQWYVNEKKIEGATEDNYTRDTSDDKGLCSVRCEVKNKAGTVVSRTAMLTVNKLPVLDESYPQNASVTVTDNATFIATVSEAGYPDSYTYQWYVNDVKVDGATEPSFTHTRTTEGNSTIYCEVTNSVGTVKTRTATLTVDRLYLYNAGNQCADVTGGWVAAWSGENSNEGYVNSLTHNSDHMHILGRRNEYAGAAGTVNKLDLSRHTKLSANAGSDFGYMRVASTLNGFNNGTIAVKQIPTSGSIFSIDISNIDSGHIVFDAQANDTTGFATWVSSVWLG